VKEKFRPGFLQILGNTLWLLTDKILEVGFGLLVGIWVARYLGPKQLGTFSYAISFVSFFGQIASLGLDEIIIREIAKETRASNQILGTAFLLKLLGSLLCAFLSISIIFLIKPDNRTIEILVILASISFFFNPLQTVQLWFQSQLQAKYIVISKRIVYAIVLAARVALINIHASLISFGVLFLCETILVAVAPLFIYQLQGGRILNWKFNLVMAKEYLNESWPLIFAGLSIQIYSKIDQILLGTMISDESEIGFYSIAVKLSEFCDFIPIILSSSLLPKLTAKRESKEDYLKGLQVFFDLMFVSWISVALPISLLSGPIIQVLYGSAYSPTALILSIYIWAQFGTNFGVARNSFLIIEGKTKLSLYLCIVGAILNISINIFMIPRFGALGATFATLLTNFVIIIAANFVVADLKPISKMILRSANPVRSIDRIKQVLI
jgi:PST family polysaccharide transporter